MFTLHTASVRRGLAALLASICITALPGCGMSDPGAISGAGNRDADEERGDSHEEDGREALELTERQKALLEEQGLPTEYDKLTDTQKNAIVSVEALLTYLEEKYGEEFCYLSYAEAGPLEEEHLEAYPASGAPTDVVTVYRTYEDETYHYEDDYGNIQVTPLYESVVRAFAAEHFSEDGIKVFSDIKALAQDTEAQSITEEDILQSASAVTYIFISENICTEAQFQEFKDDCAQWIEANIRGTAAQICLRLTDAAQWESVDPSDYEDKLREDIFTAKAECAVSEAGKVTVY